MTQVQTLHMAKKGLGFIRKVDVPAGRSIEEIAKSFYGDRGGISAWVPAPKGYEQEWIEVPRDMWEMVKPRAEVRFSYRPHGDFFDAVGDFFEDVIDFIVDPILDFFTPDTPQAQVAFAQPDRDRGRDSSRDFANVDSDSNVIRKADYLPLVIGTRRISPPEIAQPFPFIDEGIQSFKRIFALDGAHLLSNIQVDGAPTDDNDSITTETIDGQPAAATETALVTKVSSVERVFEPLPSFSLDDLDLVDQDMPSDSEPRWIRFTTPFDAKLEEITLRIRMDSMVVSDDATASVRVPIKLRFRAKGSSGAWINIPEIHMIGQSSATLLQEFRVRWDSSFGDLTHGGDISYQFFQQVPEQDAGTTSDGSTGVQWQSDPFFILGGLSSPAVPIRDVDNISADRNGVRITLDPNDTDMEKQAFEWEIIRGLATDSSSLVTTTYAIAGTIYPFFISYTTASTWQVHLAQGNFLTRPGIDFVVALIDRTPCARPQTALVAVNSRGQSIRNITVLANRYVNDWDGAAWATNTTTNNPATHYRQLLFDYLTYHNIDTSLIVNADFVSWRTECIAKGYEVSTVVSGTTTKRVLELIAAAGFARPRFSDGFGVDYFRDRSMERPVQNFSARNVQDISLTWNYPPQATGLRCTFQNAADGYRDDEVQVSNPFNTSFQGYEVKDYPNIASELLVRKRATFDMLQAHFQGRRSWRIRCSIEGLICERGDMVGIVTDLLDDAHSGARIREVLTSTQFKIDQLIPVESTSEIFSILNIFTPDDLFEVGEQSICLVSTPTGTEQRTIVGIVDDHIRVDAAFSSTDILGAHIAIGPTSRFLRRVIVNDVQRLDEENAVLTCVDEAPEIFQEMEALF